MTARSTRVAVVWACALSCGLMRGQQATPQASSSQPAATGASTQDAGAVQIDRVVAIVNDDLILESDVDEERRFAVFQPYSVPVGSFSRAEAIERLVDRTLILQQARVQPEKRPTDAEVEANLMDMRKDILACRQYKCDTDAGWQSFLKANGFTDAELNKIWRERMETLAFIEQRFRTGISISDAEAREYYTKTLLPKYAARNATAPKFDSISDRIREILLQEQVSKLLDDWLKALRASGNVQMVTDGEAVK